MSKHNCSCCGAKGEATCKTKGGVWTCQNCSPSAVRIEELERELAEARRIADNLALLCYASGCGIGTKTMNEHGVMKQSAAPAGGKG